MCESLREALLRLLRRRQARVDALPAGNSTILAAASMPVQNAWLSFPPWIDRGRPLWRSRLLRRSISSAVYRPARRGRPTSGMYRSSRFHSAMQLHAGELGSTAATATRASSVQLTRRFLRHKSA